MPLTTKPQTIQATVQRITHELIEFISAQLQQRMEEALGAGMTVAPSSRTQPKKRKPEKRRRGRLPFAQERSTPARREVAAPPKKPAVVETKRAVAVKASPAAIETRFATEVAVRRVDGSSPSEMPRTLDMNCRVEGCGNRSRGPRMGFICDSHRALLSPEQQRRAREDYKVRTKRRGSPSTEPSITAASAPPDAASSPAPAAAVAPSAQPLESVDLPGGGGPAPAGSDYALTIDRARVVTPPKLGPTVELKFTVARGPQLGRVARGRFPLAGRGLTVLIEAALGETVNVADPETLVRLVGKHVLADVVASGSPPGTLAIVKNIRSSPR